MIKNNIIKVGTIGKKLFDTIKASDVKGVKSECGTCRLQIGPGSGEETIHRYKCCEKLTG